MASNTPDRKVVFVKVSQLTRRSAFTNALLHAPHQGTTMDPARLLTTPLLLLKTGSVQMGQSVTQRQTERVRERDTHTHTQKGEREARE